MAHNQQPQKGNHALPQQQQPPRRGQQGANKEADRATQDDSDPHGDNQLAQGAQLHQGDDAHCADDKAAGSRQKALGKSAGRSAK